MQDAYNLQRFVDAQRPVYAQVLRELQAGRKTSHWMWFIFPQIKGLGSSEMAQRYGLGSVAEAAAYLAHPVLGERLEECTRLVLGAEGRTIGEIFGSPDDLKFRSSITLFAQAAAEQSVFAEALRTLCGGRPDPGTMARLKDG